MRYLTEAKYRKYVQGYGFLSFARKYGDKYGKKLMDTATKTGMDAAKSPSKRVVQKTPKKLLHQAKQKVKKKMMKDEKSTYHQKKNS